MFRAHNPRSLALLIATLAAVSAPATAQIQELWSESSPLPSTANNDFGAVVAAGDINADGFPDFAVGNPSANSDSGVVRVYSGSDQAVLRTFNGRPGDRLGAAVACGDIDGDGFADVAVATDRAAATLLNHVRVYSGRTGAQLSYVTGAVDDSFGESVCIANYNNDGFGDLVIGAGDYYSASGISGRVHIYYGPTLGAWAILNGAPHEHLGRQVANVGDLDGNGTEDLALSAPGFSRPTATTCGRIILRGRDGAIHKSLGELVGQEAGNQISDCRAVGDIDGDGLVDLAIGDGTATRNGLATAGYLLVYSRSGAPQSSTQWGIVRQLDGAATNERIGSAFCGPGDVDGDGYDDLALLRYGTVIPNGSVRQRVETISGFTGLKLGSWTHEYWTGTVTMVACDHHGDGLPGFVFGNRAAHELTAYGWPQGYALPGTNDDFVLRSGLQGLTPDRSDEKTASPGQALGIHVRSPEGSYDQELTLVVAQILGRNQTPTGVPGFPGLQLQATAPVHSLYNPLGNPFGSPILGPSGIHVNLTIASALLGFDMVIQGVAFTPSTASPGAPLSCTEAHRIQVQ